MGMATNMGRNAMRGALMELNNQRHSFVVRTKRKFLKKTGIGKALALKRKIGLLGSLWRARGGRRRRRR